MPKPSKHTRLPDAHLTDMPADLQHHSDEFIIPAKDENGESFRCQFSCSPRLHAWMSDVVDSKKFPFRRDGDLMRWALYYGLNTLARIESSVPSQQASIDVCNSNVRRVDLRADMLDHVDRLAPLVEDLQRHKAWGEIASLLAFERRCAMQSIKTEPYWGQRWLDMLRERFEDVETFALSRLEFMDWKTQAPHPNGDEPKDGQAL